MQDGKSGVFLEDNSYSSIRNTVGRSPLSRTWLCLARKSRPFSCHKTRRHTSMMILLLLLSGDVEINPGPVTGRNQSEQGDFRSDPFMEKYRDQFLECMHTYSIASRLYIYKVISEDLYHQINQKLITGSEANEKFFLHLRSNATSDTIHHLCDVMSGQNDYPLMKELGEDMKKDVDLPLSSPSSQPLTTPDPPHPEPTPPSSMLDDERSRKLKQVHKSLESFYINRLRTVQCTPDVEFVRPVTVEREYHRTKQKKEIEKFLQASIHGIDRYDGSSEGIEYEDILNCGEVVSGKRVVISGAPGCGKTTLSRKLCKDLYSQSLPNQYHLVLLVELRWLKLWLNTVREDIDLEFLFTQYQEILDTSDLYQLLKCNSGEGVALILDGFDEIADQLENSRFFTNLLSVDSPYLCECDVVITTRPSRCYDLISLIKRPSRRVEILGFTDTGIDKYIKSFYNGVCKKDVSRAQCMTDEMIQKLNSRPLLRGICRIPRALEILCKVNEYLGSNPLPETKSGIFSTYICHQLVNYLETSTGKLPSICVQDVLNVPTNQFPGFYSLCEVAYKCCIDEKGQRLILTVDDLGDMMGYLDKQGSIYNLLFSEEASPISGVLYQFNHKTVQETLAAIHIAKLNEDHQKIWKEHFCRPEMAEVWIIYCSLTKLKNVDLKELSYSVLSQHVREVVGHGLFGIDDMVVMTSLFEADNSSLSSKILRDLFKTSFTAYVRSSYYDAQVVRYSLQHHSALHRLQIWDTSTADAVFTDELMPFLMPRLRELICHQLNENDLTALSKAIVKAQHLETFTLPMELGVQERNVPNRVEVVLSALTELQTLKTLTLYMSPYELYYRGSEKIQEDCRKIVEALEANSCLKEFHLKTWSDDCYPSLSIIIEHLCRNERLSEVTIDLNGKYEVPVQLWKSLLVHREKCTVKMSLTRQQWCIVLSGLRDAKKLKELVVHMYYSTDIKFSIPDQSDQCLISSDEVEELVATSEQLVKVEVGHDPRRSEDVGDLILSMVRGVYKNKNVSELGVVFRKNMFIYYDYKKCLNPTGSVVASTLKIMAAHTDHITCVRFECMDYPLVTLIGDDWCQLLVDGPMSRRECHLKLDLTSAQCRQLLSKVNDAKGLEELSLTIRYGRGGESTLGVYDNVTVEAVEEVCSNCKLRKMRLQFGGSSDFRLISWTNLFVAVVEGIAFNNDIDFVLEGDYLSGDDIMSQLPPHSVERFEVVKRGGWEFIISKPSAPTGRSKRSPSQSTPSHSSSTPRAKRPHVSPVSKPVTSTSRVLRPRASKKKPTLTPPRTSNPVKTKKRSPSPSTSRGLRRCAQLKTSANSRSTKSFHSQKKSDDVIKSTSDLLPYMDKMLAHLTLLGTVLGIEDHTSAVVNGPGNFEDKCIDILKQWLKVTPHPTWTLFCDRLKKAKTFNNLRSKICRDKSC